MRKEAQVKDGFLRVADDLLEAIARADLTPRNSRIIMWIMCHTYGRRIKVKGAWIALNLIEISHRMVALDLDIHISRVKDSIREMIDLGILKRLNNGAIGINSHLDQWHCQFLGRDFQIKSHGRFVPGTNCPRDKMAVKTADLAVNAADLAAKTANLSQGPRTRAESCESSERERGDAKASQTATAPSFLLPNGKTDTASNRVDLAHIRFSPDKAPDWNRIDFGLRKAMQEQWDADSESNAQEARAAATLAEMDRQRAESPKMDPKQAETARKAMIAELCKRLKR